jgi:5'-3' exonuclease
MGKTLVVDFANFSHRCRAGFNNDGTSFLFKFVRNFRALVAQHQPTSIVLVKEGSPAHRYELFKEYKGNRKIKENDPKLDQKWKELMNFKEKADEAIQFALKNLEVTVLRHARLEADDLIYNYARFLAEKGEDVVVASNDKDFAQLLWDIKLRPTPGLVSVWDPGTKAFVKTPEVDPTVVKALTGDKSDNIPGIQGYGPKKALLAAADTGFARTYADDGQFAEDFHRNIKLIEFAKMSEDDWVRVEAQRGKWDPAALMIDFHAYSFTTLVTDKALNSYYDTFGGMVPAKLPVRTR